MWNVLRTVLDPEAGLSVVDLGLVYALAVSGSGIRVEMTMTSPACPMGESILADAEAAIGEAAPGVPVDVVLVWDPPWHPERMSDDARERFGW